MVHVGGGLLRRVDQESHRQSKLDDSTYAILPSDHKSKAGISR